MSLPASAVIPVVKNKVIVSESVGQYPLPVVDKIMVVEPAETSDAVGVYAAFKLLALGLKLPGATQSPPVAPVTASASVAPVALVAPEAPVFD